MTTNAASWPTTSASAAGDRVQRAAVEREVRVKDAGRVLRVQRRQDVGPQRLLLVPDVPQVQEPVAEEERLLVDHRPDADPDDQAGEATPADAVSHRRRPPRPGPARRRRPALRWPSPTRAQSGSAASPGAVAATAPRPRSQGRAGRERDQPSRLDRERVRGRHGDLRGARLGVLVDLQERVARLVARGDLWRPRP